MFSVLICCYCVICFFISIIFAHFIFRFCYYSLVAYCVLPPLPSSWSSSPLIVRKAAETNLLSVKKWFYWSFSIYSVLWYERFCFMPTIWYSFSLIFGRLKFIFILFFMRNIQSNWLIVYVMASIAATHNNKIITETRMKRKNIWFQFIWLFFTNFSFFLFFSEYRQIQIHNKKKTPTNT